MTKVNYFNYGNYSSSNYGVHTLAFMDAEGNTFYFSYDTLIAFKTNGGLFVRKNEWGQTTGKHLNWIDGGNKQARLSEEDFKKAYNDAFDKETVTR